MLSLFVPQKRRNDTHSYAQAVQGAYSEFNVLNAMLCLYLIEFLTWTFHFVGVNEDKGRAFLIITFYETR